MLEDPDLSNDRSVKRKSKPNFSFRKKCTAINILLRLLKLNKYSFTQLHRPLHSLIPLIPTRQILIKVIVNMHRITIPKITTPTQTRIIDNEFDKAPDGFGYFRVAREYFGVGQSLFVVIHHIRAFL